MAGLVNFPPLSPPPPDPTKRNLTESRWFQGDRSGWEECSGLGEPQAPAPSWLTDGPAAPGTTEPKAPGGLSQAPSSSVLPPSEGSVWIVGPRGKDIAFFPAPFFALNLKCSQCFGGARLGSWYSPANKKATDELCVSSPPDPPPQSLQ